MAAIHLVCPSCGRVNRVPADKDSGAAKCGVCHTPMFHGRPVAVDQAGFERHVGKGDLPVLVDVWAPWCGPCRTMGPMFEQAAGQLEPAVRLVKLNADEAPEISARFGIQGIPTLLLLKSGRLLARISGVMNTAQIVAWTRQNLVQPASGA